MDDAAMKEFKERVLCDLSEIKMGQAIISEKVNNLKTDVVVLETQVKTRASMWGAISGVVVGLIGLIAAILSR